MTDLDRFIWMLNMADYTEIPYSMRGRLGEFQYMRAQAPCVEYSRITLVVVGQGNGHRGCESTWVFDNEGRFRTQAAFSNK